MNDASIIIPATSNNPRVFTRCLAGVRSCRASTEYPIMVVDNMTEKGSELQRNFEDECSRMGIRYHLWPKSFSMSEIWNFGIDETTSKYIAFGNADVAYGNKWLENIVELWEERPHYYFLWPSSAHRGSERMIQDERYPTGGALVLKRSNNYRFDEYYRGWEIDAEIYYFLEANSLMGGMVLNSKTDHDLASIRDNVPGCDFGFDGRREYMEKKWNIPPPREQPRYQGWKPSTDWVNPTPPEFLVNYK